MKKSIAIAAALLAGLGAYGAEQSCVKCHANEAAMKSLFVPPVIASSEGEG
ncbi:MAG TPA: hypothetical protein PLB91_00485 [Spirochaetales bacterium]|nr:hypothetical protein [Spirochaetales bacterium]HRY53636.1 hypothetical protein [Spirochaetia bacterium]HRZ63733.1 hypothetical protein [Spirochaetia bacterium]